MTQDPDKATVAEDGEQVSPPSSADTKPEQQENPEEPGGEPEKVPAEKVYEEVGRNYRFFARWRYLMVAGVLAVVFGAFTLLNSAFEVEAARQHLWAIPACAALVCFLLVVADYRTRQLSIFAVEAGKELEENTAGFFKKQSEANLVLYKDPHTIAGWLISLASATALALLSVNLANLPMPAGPYQPAHPDDFVRIVEGAAYVVPQDRVLVITGFGLDSHHPDVVHITVTVNGSPVFAARCNDLNSEKPQSLEIHPGIVAHEGSVVDALAYGRSGGAPRAVLLGFLADK